MRLPLRTRLLIVPALVLASTAVATAYAASHAARGANARIEDRQQAIARTLTGPPTFPLTLPVLLQMRNLTGAEFAAGSVSTLPGTLPAGEYIESRIELPATHPNAGSTVIVSYPEAIRRGEVNDAVRPVLALGVGAGLLATVLSLIVSRWLVQRIRTIEAGTRAIAAGHFEPLQSPAKDDELGDLVTSVNAMARQLAANVESLKQSERLRVLGQVSGGLAHQLRNAASGARLAVQLAVDDPADAEPLAVAIRQLQRMESILKQFLELGPCEPKRQLVNLTDLAARAVAHFESLAKHHEVNLTFDHECTMIQKHADPELIDHLLENLIMNAIEAAGPGGRVMLKLSPSAIEVHDSGPGLRDDVAAKLFEPFVTTKPGGIGLGLVVAKQVADAHGAKLTWARRGETTVFSVELTNPSEPEA